MIAQRCKKCQPDGGGSGWKALFEVLCRQSQAALRERGEEL